MNAIAEIDKAGRVVVPKKMRDALHLVPGTRLTIRTQGGMVVLEPEQRGRGLHLRDGVMVYDPGPLTGPFVDWLESDRDARLDEVFASGQR